MSSCTLSLFPCIRRTLSVSGLALVAALGLASGCGQDPDAVAPLGAVESSAEIRIPSGMVDSSLDALFRQMGSDDIGARTDLRATAGYADDLAIVHTRFRQHVDGIPVFGGEAIVHLRGDGSTFAVTDRLQRGLRVDSKAKLSPQRAIALAIEHHGRGSGSLTADPKAELFVLRRDDRDRLVYRVQLRQEDGTAETSLPVFFIDAHTGENVFSYDNLQTATGSGQSLYVGNVSVETNLKSGVYYLEDLGRRMGTFDSRNSTAQTYRFTDSDNVWNSSTQQAAVDAHYGASKVFDYYLNVHGRRGIDGNGGPGYYTGIDGTTPLISSRVHYSRKYNNAFWNGSLMT
ncbi:MAG: PepSY domain-containing protein [Polyangia bacterium]